jgi:hypothetical protein
MNTYLLTYNPFDPKVSAGQLLAYIRDSRKIVQYYQPWLGTYVIKSYEALASLTEGFGGIFDTSPYFIAVIESTQTGGRLDPIIWQWINTGTLPALTTETERKALF